MLAVAACSGWLPFVNRPLSPDEGGFLVVASQWSEGSSLYGDYWVDRPPLLIAIFEVADRLGGALPLRVIGTLAVVAAVVLAGLVGRAAAPGQPRGVLLPAATAAILAATPLFGGSVVNGELLGLPFLLAGMAALLAAQTAPRTWLVLGLGTAAGISGLLAALVKQSLLDVFVLALALLAGRAGSARAFAGLVIGAVATAGVALTMAASRGTEVGELWHALVGFRLDAAQVLADSTESTVGRFGALLLSLLFSGAPVLVALLGWTSRTRPQPMKREPPDLRGPAYAVLAFELVVVLLGGSYWLHYLMGVVPGAVLLAAASAQRPLRARRALVAAYAFAAISTAGVTGWLGLHPIDRPEEPVIAYLDRHAAEGDSAVVAFGGANVLREVGLTCPYPYLWSLPVRVHDPGLEELTALLASTDAPTWLIVSNRALDAWDLDFSEPQAQLDDRYTEVAEPGRFTVYRLADGA